MEQPGRLVHQDSHAEVGPPGPVKRRVLDITSVVRATSLRAAAGPYEEKSPGVLCSQQSPRAMQCTEGLSRQAKPAVAGELFHGGRCSRELLKSRNVVGMNKLQHEVEFSS